MSFKAEAIQANITRASGELNLVEAKLKGNLSDKERITMEGVAQELRNKLRCFNEQKDEMAGVGLECKTPKKPEPILESREPEPALPPTDEQLMKQMEEQGYRNPFING